jgi:hypothetical protein
MWFYTLFLLLALASAQDAPQSEEFTSHFWNGIDAAEQDQVRALCVAHLQSTGTLITTCSALAYQITAYWRNSRS